MRPSFVGPRLEKSAMWPALSALPSSSPQKIPPSGRRLSEAPTVIAFLAVPGDATLPQPSLPPPPTSSPELPAATTSTIGWLPDTPG